jgi:hypothetical protein
MLSSQWGGCGRYQFVLTLAEDNDVALDFGQALGLFWVRERTL